MKAKHMMFFMLGLSLMLSVVSGCSNGTETKSEELQAQGSEQTVQQEIEAMIPTNEYERAMWYGFLQDDLITTNPEDTIVTWAQYCEMLGSMVKLHDESAYLEWQEMTKDAPDTEIKRDGAAIALLYAGQLTDRYYCNADPNNYYNETYLWGHHFSWDYPIFDWNSEIEPFEDNMEVFDRSNAVASAFWYLMGRVSCITSQPLLDIEDGDPNLEAPLTLYDAALSVTRLYESEEDVVLKTADTLLNLVKETPEGQEIVQAAEQRKKEILSTETKIVKSDEYVQGETYTGTAYYVSNSGDDSADGHSPETAWATIERLGKAKFTFGDAIFFERGGLWRKVEMPESVLGTEGLTLSAYGTGEKPRFYGSPENGTGAEKWTLYHEGKNGEKIWVYYTEMPDCAGVVLNGKDIIKRDVAYWDGTAFMCMNNISTPYTIEEQLEDMESFSALPYQQAPKTEYLTEATWLGVAIYKDENGQNLMGPLYVRCDAGNPGELYEEIEFITAYKAFSKMSDYTTLDNLCIRYSSGGVSGGYWKGISNDHLTVQNSEVGFNGGALNWFGVQQNAHGFGHAHMDGGGFNLNGSYETIRNCYGHHCFQDALTIETFDGDPEPCIGNILKDNVVEYSVMGMPIVNWETDEMSEHQLQDVLFENNYILYSGFETLYNVKPSIESEKEFEDIHWPNRLGFVVLDSAALVVKHGGENYSIKGNTFAFSASQVVNASEINIPESAQYEGNTYAPLPGFALIGVMENEWGPLVLDNTDDAILETLGDQTANIIHFGK